MLDLPWPSFRRPKGGEVMAMMELEDDLDDVYGLMTDLRGEGNGNGG